MLSEFKQWTAVGTNCDWFQIWSDIRAVAGWQLPFAAKAIFTTKCRYLSTTVQCIAIFGTQAVLLWLVKTAQSIHPELPLPTWNVCYGILNLCWNILTFSATAHREQLLKYLPPLQRPSVNTSETTNLTLYLTVSQRTVRANFCTKNSAMSRPH